MHVQSTQEYPKSVSLIFASAVSDCRAFLNLEIRKEIAPKNLNDCFL